MPHFAYKKKKEKPHIIPKQSFKVTMILYVMLNTVAALQLCLGSSVKWKASKRKKKKRVIETVENQRT